MKKRKKYIGLLDMIFYLFGGAVYALAVVMIVTPNQISPGGVTGIASLLNVLFSLPVGTTVFLLNLPLLAAGFLRFGGFFILKTGIATLTVSLWLDLFSPLIKPVTLDPILAAIFGGVLMGTGLGIVMLRGATTGGMDIVAKLIHQKFPHITVGRVMLAGDAAVVLLAALVYQNPASGLYSIVALYASSRVMDTLLYGSDKGKMIYIVTSKPEEASDRITEIMRRGVSLMEVVGGYTGKRHTMLMCTVRRHEVSQLLQIVKALDPQAFIVVGEAGEIIGEGFKPMEKD